MAGNRQQYQKTGAYAASRRWSGFSVAGRRPFPRAGLVAAVALIAGCAGTPDVDAADAAARQGADSAVLAGSVDAASDVVLVADASGSIGAAAQNRRSAPVPAGDVRPPVVPPAARQAVIDAREAMQKKQWKTVESRVAYAVPDPVLGDYPRYWWLRQQLHDSTRPIPEALLQQFLQSSRNDNLIDRLKGDWIVAAVRAGDYGRALQLAPVKTGGASVDCSLILARHLASQHVDAAEATDAFAPTAACWSMMDQLAAAQVVSRDQLIFELRAILETNKTQTAQRMAAIVFDGAQMTQYAALMKNPKQWLTQRGKPATAADIDLAAIALSRLARSDDRGAQVAWMEQKWAGWLPPEHLQWVYSQFGLIAALNVDPDAARWYRRSGGQRLTDYNHAWEVRAELREQPIDWSRVQATIDRMSARQASEPVWVYWKARALHAQGQQDAASRLYASIANDLNFYGQLANEELGHSPFIPDLPKPVSDYEYRQAQSNPGLQRAIQLFDLGWRTEAVQEWVFALKGLNDRDLLAAAEFARQEQVYDRVVNTSLLTRDHIDFTQRFIAPFEGRVSEKARAINLDPAWVYGLIRQESRFITDARSRVGASGLMQLMPDTARWVAKKIGMTDFRISDINEFETNTVLGTNYLRLVLERLDGSEVLATAGYNAGPGRPVRWRSRLSGPVEGAIFAETIPFTETRLYVKNVMSNAVYYAMLFSGQPQSLKARLGTITPRGASQVAMP